MNKKKEMVLIQNQVPNLLLHQQNQSNRIFLILLLNQESLSMIRKLRYSHLEYLSSYLSISTL